MMMVSLNYKEMAKDYRFKRGLERLVLASGKWSSCCIDV